MKSVNQPNVLLVVVDEWRAQAFGYAGDGNAHTPHIDKLASESLNFAEAVSGTPVCCPARASFMTGQYPLDHGVYINDVELTPTSTTLAEAFRTAGYQTGYIGKWHLFGSPAGHFERRDAFVPPAARLGFDHWCAAECTHDYWHSQYFRNNDTAPRVWPGYDAFAQTEEALDFAARRQNADDPFFLMLSFGPPHFPLRTAPEEFRDLYRDRGIELPPNVPSRYAELADRDLRGYYAHMAAIDSCIGRLMAELESNPALDNTIVVFTSDHGDMMWSHGLEHKLVPWEESIRVPLLVRGPGIEPGVTRTLFNSPDLMPTILGFAGIEPPPGIQGVDCSASNTQIDSAYLSAPVSFSTLRKEGIAEYRGVRTERYTFVCTRDAPWLLFDNRSDPHQLTNLVQNDAYISVVESLEQEVSKWRSRLSDEFRPGEYYLQRDALTHYVEVNEPIGCSGEPTEGWVSTLEAERC